MTEYTLSNRIAGTLLQIKKAIVQLQDWNKDIQNVDDYYSTPEGMKNLAASCMLIEAIGEGVKQVVIINNIYPKHLRRDFLLP